MNESQNRSVLLPDGRRLAYAEYGDPDGQVVVWIHGLPGSRLDWSIGNGPALLTELGLRLIAPDRPGFGRSTPHNRRTHASFATDLDSLTDALGIETSTLLGYSAGAPYALAAAHAKTGHLHVDGVVLVSPIGPRSTPHFGDGLGQTDKVMLTLARVPPVARLAMTSAIRSAREEPDKFPTTLRKDFSASASDTRLLDECDTAERVLTRSSRPQRKAPGVVSATGRCGGSGPSIRRMIKSPPTSGTATTIHSSLCTTLSICNNSAPAHTSTSGAAKGTYTTTMYGDRSSPHSRDPRREASYRFWAQQSAPAGRDHA